MAVIPSSPYIISSDFILRPYIVYHSSSLCYSSSLPPHPHRERMPSQDPSLTFLPPPPPFSIPFTSVGQERSCPNRAAALFARHTLPGPSAQHLVIRDPKKGTGLCHHPPVGSPFSPPTARVSILPLVRSRVPPHRRLPADRSSVCPCHPPRVQGSSHDGGALQEILFRHLE